jgi:hypothetical protein
LQIHFKFAKHITYCLDGNDTAGMETNSSGNENLFWRMLWLGCNVDDVTNSRNNFNHLYFNTNSSAVDDIICINAIIYINDIIII